MPRTSDGHPSRQPWLAVLALTLAASAPGRMAAAEDQAASPPVRSGVQHYEVTIAPPHRPGTEVPEPAAAEGVEPESEPPAAGAAPATSAPAPVHPAPAAPGTAASGMAAPTTGGAATESSAPPAAAAKAGDESRGPRLSLQVGAYRQRPSAEKLRDTLSASFRDVAVIDTTSGGEPLYRVRVGRLPKGAALEEMKRRLLAAGYPAFEVPAIDERKP